MSKYQGRVDPIEQLRGAYLLNSGSKTKIKQKDHYLYFDQDIKLNLKTETAWVSTALNKQYNLGSLWLFMEYHIENIPTKTQYIQKVSELKMDMVNIADQDQIVKYFTGVIADTPCIKQELKMAISQKGHKHMREAPGSGFQGGDEGPTKKVKTDQPFDLQVVDYLFQYQRPVNSRSKCIRYPYKSFEKIIQDLAEKEKRQKQTQKQNNKTRIASFYEKKKMPIIIVPNLVQAGNVSIHNIEKFLIEGIYDDQIRHENPHIAKSEFQYNLRGKNIYFEVTSNPTLLRLDDWQYVVAVFVMGSEAQFEGWAIPDPRKIFDKIKGYFMKFCGSVFRCAQDWNVKNLILNRNVRYEDRQLVKIIWTDIENYLFEKI